MYTHSTAKHGQTNHSTKQEIRSLGMFSFAMLYASVNININVNIKINMKINMNINIQR